MTLLTPWTPSQKTAYRDGIVTFTHDLAGTGLFEDASLARLIDAHPRDMLDVCTMRRDPPPGEPWIAGDPGELTRRRPDRGGEARPPLGQPAPGHERARRDQARAWTA